jgi:hypothetical protein
MLRLPLLSNRKHSLNGTGSKLEVTSTSYVIPLTPLAQTASDVAQAAVATRATTKITFFLLNSKDV